MGINAASVSAFLEGLCVGGYRNALRFAAWDGILHRRLSAGREGIRKKIDVATLSRQIDPILRFA
jgi:hypothetical protein